MQQAQYRKWGKLTEIVYVEHIGDYLAGFKGVCGDNGHRDLVRERVGGWKASRPDGGADRYFLGGVRIERQGLAEITDSRITPICTYMTGVTQFGSHNPTQPASITRLQHPRPLWPSLGAKRQSF